MGNPTTVRLDDDVKKYLELLHEERGDSISRLINRGLKKGLPLLDPEEEPTMRYYEALEKRDADGNPSGIWHYTMTLDKNTMPARACADGCPGHASKDEAYEHERARRIAEALFDLEFSNWTSCVHKKCNNPTKTGAHTPGILHTYPLCSEHLNTAGLTEVIVVGASMES